jgi:hypothetical protein
MENYSFRDHVLQHFQLLMTENGFTVQEPKKKSSPTLPFDVVLWVSAKCKVQIFHEYSKVFVEVAPLAMRTINDWYPIYVVIAFLSDAKAEKWAWLMESPSKCSFTEVIDTQLARWHTLASDNIGQIADLFEEHSFREMAQKLDEFRTTFYSNLRQLSKR